MKNQTFTGRLVLGFALCCMPLLTMACSAADDSAENPESAGRLTFALTSTTANGVVYRLRDATFDIKAGSFDQGSLSSETDPNSSTLIPQLKPGAYTVSLISSFQLEKEVAGAYVDVPAELLSPRTQAFDITAGASTAVAYEFKVAGEVVTMGGSLVVSTHVVEESYQDDPAEKPDPQYQNIVFAGKADPKFRYEVRALGEKDELISSFPVYAGDGPVLSGDTLRIDGAVALQTAVWMNDDLVTVSEPQSFEPGAATELELPEGLGYLSLIPVSVSVGEEQVSEELRRYDFNVLDTEGQQVAIDPQLVQWIWPIGPDVVPVFPKPPLTCPNVACVFVPLGPKERLTPGPTPCVGRLCGATEPDPDPPPSGWKSVAAGDGFSCGLTHQGRVLCWGEGVSGDLGYPAWRPCVLPPTAPSTAQCRWVPKEIVLPPGSMATFQALDAGRGHVCAVDTLGDVWCWGQLAFSEGSLCPAGAPACHRAPFRLSPNDPSVPNTPARFKSVSAGSDHTCALTVGGSVLCFGGNVFGEAGDTSPGRTFNAVGSVGRYLSVSSGVRHTCALTLKGKVECWGYTIALSSLPPQIPEHERFLGEPRDVMSDHPSIAPGEADLVSAGKFRTCIHDVHGTLSCFDELGGSRTSVEYIDPTTTDLETSLMDYESKCQVERGNLYCDLHQASMLRTQLPFSSPVVDSSVELLHGCAVESDGTAWCWGMNDQGQLGDGSLVDADPSHPVAVLPP